MIGTSETDTTCGTCGNPLRSEDAAVCEEVHCFDAGVLHCRSCVTAVQRMVFCKRHLATWNGEDES